MKGWLLIETLLVLLVANALVWFVVAVESELPHANMTLNDTIAWT